MWQEHFKTRQEAFGHILEQLVANPAVAGLDGLLTVIIGKNYYVLRPISRTKANTLKKMNYEER